MIREVDDEQGIQGLRYVRLEVLLMPSDKTKVAGEVVMYDPEPKHQISAHRSGLPTEIEVARTLAWKIARERKADVIWINDPKGIYPKGSRVVRPDPV